MAHSQTEAAQPQFVRWSENSHNKHCEDLVDDKSAQQIVRALLDRIFAPDFEKLTIRGNLDIAGFNSLRFVVYHQCGDIWRTVDVEAPYSGLVIIHADDVESAIHRDLEGTLCREWLPALGLPPDLPVGCDLLIRKGGGIDISLTPNF